MYTLDANIFVRDADPRDPDHVLCHELLERLTRAGSILVEPLLVMAEVSGTVSRVHRDPMRGRLAVELLRDLPHVQFVPLDDTLAVETAYLAADYGLRGADALYVAVARRSGAALVTLDRKVHARAAAVVRTFTSDEALGAAG